MFHDMPDRTALFNSIKGGIKLRPTSTVDKSKPIIVAEDEEPVSIRYVKPEKEADLSYLFQKKDPDDIVVWRPRSIVPPPIIHKGKAMDGPIERSRPTTPNPPNGNNLTKPALLKLGGQAPQDVDRRALLNSITGGIKLRKTVTVDKSKPVIEAEIEEEEQGAKQMARPVKPAVNNVSAAPIPVSSPKSPDAETKPTKVRRRSSTAKVKPSTPTTPSTPSTPKSFVPAKAISNAPPPPPPMKITPAQVSATPPPPPPPMPLGAQNSVAKPAYSRPNNSVPPPPPPVPPPPPPSMPTQKSYNPPPVSKPAYELKRWEPKPKVEPEPQPEIKKCDIEYDEKNLYVTKESLDAEIKKGAASNRIALFKKFEQKDAYIPMPKTSFPPIQPGKLKIIENAAPKEKPKETPITNGRLKIHETPAPISKPKKEIKIESPGENDVCASFILPSKKYSVPITVKTDNPTPTTNTLSPKKTVKKLSNGKIKKSPKPKTTTDTLSPASTRCDSLSPNSTSSAYQSGHSNINSPNSVSSISPKSKSSGVSSATSSVSPPLRTTSISNGTTNVTTNGTANGTSTREKTPPFSTYNPKTRSITSERFSKLRSSFSDKPNVVDESNTSTTITLPKPVGSKLKESGEEFWKNALAKSNGTTATTPKATPIEIKTPWKATTSISSPPPLKTTITSKKPPEVPPKRRVTPISIKVSNNLNNSYFDSSSTDPLDLRQRYKFNIDFKRRECPVEIVQL